MSKKTEIAKKEVTETEKSETINDFSDFSIDELENLQEATGLEEIPEEKRRLPLIIWNQDRTTETGLDLTKDLFYNMRSEEVYDEINCALVSIKPTRLYEKRNAEDGGKTKFRVCSSFDMKVGNFVTPKGIILRRCDKCEYKFSSGQNKRKPCTIVQRFVAYDLDRNELFTFNAQRSSFVPLSNYIEKNFFGKLKIGDKRVDIPLYMINTKLTLKEEMGVTRYYVLKPESNGIIKNKILILNLKDIAKRIKDMSQQEFEEETKNDYAVIDDDTGDYINKDNNENDDDNDDVPF
jgi:hypothetical protein